MGFWTWIGNKIDGNFEEKTKNQSKPEPQPPTPEEIIWTSKFEMKQCIKRMRKSIREREEKVKNEFEQVNSFLRAGDNQAARVHANAAATYKNRIAQSHKQLVTFELMFDKMDDGSFSAEAAKILGDMANAIKGMADPLEVQNQIQKVAQCEEIVNELGETMTDTGDIDSMDIQTETEKILIQAANGVNSNPEESALNLNGNSVNANGKDSIETEANDGLKSLEDLINGKK